MRHLATGLGVLWVAYLAAAVWLRPLHRSWGSTAEERALALPGDIAPRHPAFEVNRAVSIAAPPEAIYPYLLQMGQDRGGFYSYDALENLLGLEVRSADHVVPEFQEREVGDLVRAAPPGWMGGRFGDERGWRITHLEENRAFVLDHWASFVLLPEAGGSTRLIARTTTASPRARPLVSAIDLLFIELPHFVMERRMLLGIRERAERDHRGR